MTKKIATWTNDTCGYTLEYEWDDNGNDFEDKEITFYGAPHDCGGHLAIQNKQRVYEVVRRGNVNKNLAYKALIEETDFGEDTDTDEERAIRTLRPNFTFEYQFTGDDPEHRVLEFSLLDNKTKQKVKIPKTDKDKTNNALKNKVDQKLRKIADITRI